MCGIDDKKQKKAAMKYKIPVGKIICPHCGAIVSGQLEPVCGFCGKNYWEGSWTKCSCTVTEGLAINQLHLTIDADCPFHGHRYES